MKKINIIVIIISILLTTVNLDAAKSKLGTTAGEFIKVGAAGAQFLKIGIGARANGMAGAQASASNDLSAIYWNPAGLADIRTMSANFSYTQWFASFKHNFAAISMPIGDYFTIAGHLITFGCDKIEITNFDRPEGTGNYYSVNDLAMGLSFSGYLTDQFSFGFTGRYVYNSFADLSSNGFSFDVGTIYQTGIQGIKLGFSIHNLGTEMEYSGQDLNTTKKIVDELNMSPLDAQYLTNPYSMPLIFRAGISSEVINTEDEEHKLIAALDFITFSDVPEQFILGAEYTWNKILSLRAGYRIGHDQMNLAGGVGINYIGGGFSGQFDYSISPTKDLGWINRISVGVNLK